MKLLWISQVPMKATWLPLNTLFHAPNTVWVSKTAHVFLIGFCFHDTQANIKGIPLSSWCIIWIPGCLPSLMFSWDWESIGPSASTGSAFAIWLEEIGSCLIGSKWTGSKSFLCAAQIQSWKDCLWKVERHIFEVMLSLVYLHTLTRKSSVLIQFMEHLLYARCFISLSLIQKPHVSFVFPLSRSVPRLREINWDAQRCAA